MKNTFFIKKKCEKIALFLCVSCVFSEFLENRKIFTSTKFFRIFTVAACKYTGDHRQIMGRSWATSRPYRNQVSKKKFAKNFSRKKVSRANFVIILILHVKLSKRYPIVRKKRTIFYIALL